MLTPEQLDTIPDRMDALYREFDENVIRIYANTIKTAGKVTEDAEWIEIRAEAVGLAKEDLQKETARILELSDDEIHKLFGDVAFTSADADRERFESEGLSAERITKHDFLSQYIEAAWKQTLGEFENIGATTGFVIDGKFMDFTKALYKELDMVQLQVSHGILDYNTAIKQSVKRVVSHGVSTIYYESGYKMNIASAARMITLTGVNQMARQMNEGICDELGLDLVEVTAHAGARPSHKEWQGQIYSRSGKSNKYPPLVESTGLGNVDGLCGANCRHNYYGYFDGSSRAYSDDDLKNIDPPPFTYNDREYTYYEATQRMRYMERQMRKVKREKCAYEEAEMQGDIDACNIKLGRMEVEYSKFSNAAGISPRYERTEYIKGT